MNGSKRLLLALSVAGTVIAGLLIGWTIGLVDADLVSREESAVFLALGLLFLVVLVGFLIEVTLVNGDSS